MISSITAANYFINRGRQEGVYFSPMQLLKLVYIAHGWSLAVLDKPLLNEQIEAWRYGPVIPSLYDHIKHYGRLPVDSCIHESYFSFSSPIPDDLEHALSFVYKNYYTYQAFQLSDMTHRKGTPWDTVYVEGYKNAIPDALIKQHYQDKADVLEKQRGGG